MPPVPGVSCVPVVNVGLTCTIPVGGLDTLNCPPLPIEPRLGEEVRK